MKALRFVAVLVIGWSMIFWRPVKAMADEYDDSQSNPLRVIAYGLHPAGVILEWLIFRPFHALVSNSPQNEYFFGHRPHPPLFADPQPIYDYGVPNRVPMKPEAPPRAAAPQEPVSENVTVKEVTVERTVLKEVPKIIEVERVVFPDVAFRFDSAELTDLGKGKVYLAAQKLKGKSDVVVVVEGHADSIGNDDYNQKLALRRAQRVMKELSQLGIDPARMSTASLGKSQPLIDQPTDWARAVNRRVEFRISTP
jgi:outer membrane protein OmpA-like peptidoglycan-associated protein